MIEEAQLDRIESSHGRPGKSGEAHLRVQRVVAGREVAVAVGDEGGSTVLQISGAYRQRVWKRQAAGGAIGLGTSPRRTMWPRVEHLGDDEAERDQSDAVLAEPLPEELPGCPPGDLRLGVVTGEIEGGLFPDGQAGHRGRSGSASTNMLHGSVAHG